MPDVLWLTRYGPEGASSRYRAYQLEAGLRAAGWTSTYEPLTLLRGSAAGSAAGIVRRVRRLRGLGRETDVDAVVVQKEPIMPPTIHRISGVGRRGGPPVLWDIDDAVWIGRRGAHRMAGAMCARADVVVSGNALIADWAHCHGARAVEVVPTCFEPPTTTDSATEHDGVRLVWVGSPATAPLLEPYGGALRAALDSTPDLTIEVIGGPPPRAIAAHPRVIATAWSPATEHAGLAVADYGLALQPRGEYADHKCGFKIVQYLAYGIVPIASDSPVHRDIVGEVGVLVGGPAGGSMIVDVTRLRPEPPARRAAKERWRSGYSRRRAVDDWSRILIAAAGRPGGR